MLASRSRALVAAAGACGGLMALDRHLIRCDVKAHTVESSALFREWAAEIEKHPSTIKELQRRVPVRPIKKLVRASDQDQDEGKVQPKPGKSLIWHTLAGEHMIEQIRLWTCEPDTAQLDGSALKRNERRGASRVRALVQVGDEICGHPEFVHGGFTAALLDDMLGWTTFQEKAHLTDALPADIGVGSAKIFTAKLTVNYRRPVKLNGTYLVECKVMKVERVKKIWLECTIWDRAGNALVEGESLYIITGIDREKVGALYN